MGRKLFFPRASRLIAKNSGQLSQCFLSWQPRPDTSASRSAASATELHPEHRVEQFYSTLQLPAASITVTRGVCLNQDRTSHVSRPIPAPSCYITPSYSAVPLMSHGHRPRTLLALNSLAVVSRRRLCLLARNRFTKFQPHHAFLVCLQRGHARMQVDHRSMMCHRNDLSVGQSCLQQRKQ